MSVWIKVEEALPYHYKVENMRKILGTPSTIEPVGYLVFLWLYTLKVAWRDGNLQAYEDSIERNCLWAGEPGLLLKAFRGCGKKLEDGKIGPGFLDGCVVHDWVKTATRLIRERIYREERDTSEQPGQVSEESREVMGLWNAFAKEHGLSSVARAPRLPEGFGASTLKLLLAQAAKQPFLLGKGEKGWKIDLPWLLRKVNYDKVLLGTYTERVSPAAANGADTLADARARTKKLLAERAAYAAANDDPK